MTDVTSTDLRIVTCQFLRAGKRQSLDSTPTLELSPHAVVARLCPTPSHTWYSESRMTQGTGAMHANERCCS
jgi:hypothetical protein